MKRLFVQLAVFLFCVTPLFSSEKNLTPKEEYYFLRNAIDRTIQQADPHLNVGVLVVSLKNGQKLYERNVQSLFVPASTQKLFTTAAALAILGNDFRFETSLFRNQELKQGILTGDLFLKASGDPSLVTDDLEDLVFQLSATGVKEIKGDLLIDNFDFDNITLGPGWMWDEGADYWNSPLDALLVNHSCITLRIEPAKKVGLPAQVRITPEIPGVQVRNLAKTDADRKDLQVTRKWITKENLIEVTGTIDLASSGEEYWIPLESPSLYAAELLKLLLEKHKIRLSGEIHYTKVPAGATRIACHQSAPLSELILPVTKQSDNLYANCLFKKMGQLVCNAPGTWQKGSQAVLNFLADRADIDTSELVILDGDGQSRYNLVSPDQMVSFLKWAKEQFLFFPEFLSSLPISGVDGTLKGRMTDPSVRGRIRAKTGTMTGISAIAGYATTKDGELLAFAIMMNGFIKPAQEYKRDLEDQICTLLANFSREH